MVCTRLVRRTVAVAQDVVHRTRGDGSEVLLCELNRQPQVALAGSALMGELGTENVLESIDDAVERSRVLVAGRPSQRGIAVPSGIL